MNIKKIKSFLPDFYALKDYFLDLNLSHMAVAVDLIITEKIIVQQTRGNNFFVAETVNGSLWMLKSLIKNLGPQFLPFSSKELAWLGFLFAWHGFYNIYGILPTEMTENFE